MFFVVRTWILHWSKKVITTKAKVSSFLKNEAPERSDNLSKVNQQVAMYAYKHRLIIETMNILFIYRIRVVKYLVLRRWR